MTRFGPVLSALLLGLFVVSSAAAEAPRDLRSATPVPRAEPSLAHRVGDLALARPVLAVRLIVGVATLPLALPVAVVLGDPGWALDVCLRDPAADLFETPLGEL